MFGFIHSKLMIDGVNILFSSVGRFQPGNPIFTVSLIEIFSSKINREKYCENENILLFVWFHFFSFQVQGKS